MPKATNNLPPPVDGYMYVLVRTKEGPYWRRKRGSIKEAKLNPVLQRNQQLSSIVSPAAKRIFEKLKPYMGDLMPGRFIANVSGRLKQSWNATGSFNYAFMEDYQMQPDRTLSKLYSSLNRAVVRGNEVQFIIQLNPHPVKQLAKTVTGYYFELILLSGDPSKEKALRIHVESSPAFSFQTKREDVCSLSHLLPSKKSPWMALLKVGCLEGDKIVLGSRYVGMKVVAVG